MSGPFTCLAPYVCHPEIRFHPLLVRHQSRDWGHQTAGDSRSRQEEQVHRNCTPPAYVAPHQKGVVEDHEGTGDGFGEEVGETLAEALDLLKEHKTRGWDENGESPKS